MGVTIDQIKDLREKTGVSMMACKKALEESDGDSGKAIELLRKKGEAKAVDNSSRTTGQGAVAVKAEGNKIAMVELRCETDFVAMGEDYQGLAESIADKLLKGEIKETDRDLPEVKEAVLRLGENIQIADMVLLEGDSVGSYVHSNKKIGVVVALSGGNIELAKDLAMHVAATSPQVLSPTEVAQELVDKEKEIWADQLKQEGKPAEMIEKIMMGKEKKFREENALLTQPFVKDPDKMVEALLKEANAVVKEFKRFAI